MTVLVDGHPIDPTEAVANALTGPAQLAVKLASSECYWPGCHVPVSDCQIDHLIPWADHSGGGSTNPGNGGPACGRHNRHKHGFATGRGYTVHRDPTGHWHTHRPDGTEIE